MICFPTANAAGQAADFYVPLDTRSSFRLISTLVKNEFVVQHPETKRYSPGYHILEISGAFNTFSYTENLIQHLMKRIQAATNQNTHLAVIDGSEVLSLAVEQPRDHLSLNLSAGTREPGVVTALGKDILAFMPAEEVKSILTKFKYKKYTNKSVGSAAELKKNLEQVRRGYLAVDNEEYRSGIICCTICNIICRFQLKAHQTDRRNSEYIHIVRHSNGLPGKGD